jgi:hypothetical protein
MGNVALALPLGLAFALTAAITAGPAARLAAAAPEPRDLEAVRLASPPCPAEAAHCFGLVVHVAPAMDGGLVQTPAWIAAQVATANRLFAPLSVGFTIDEVRGLADRDVAIMSRAERNRLGSRLRARGRIDVFVVARLGDVDDSRHDINGVHWRRGGRRWIIHSGRAWELTLGHELGHYFGLPHSDVAASLMNTTHRVAPPIGERIFQPDELARMRGFLRRTLRTRTLRDRVAPPVRATGR